MISGTNGLLGAADGVFLMEKVQRIQPTAELSISGRDQPDQVLTIQRDSETLCWELEGRSSENWTVPPDPMLERIHGMLLTEPNERWKGPSTKLVELLELDISPVALTKRLNVNAERLLQDYRIHYEWRRGHEGRTIVLERLIPKA